MSVRHSWTCQRLASTGHGGVAVVTHLARVLRMLVAMCRAATTDGGGVATLVASISADVGYPLGRVGGEWASEHLARTRWRLAKFDMLARATVLRMVVTIRMATVSRQGA